MDFDLLSPTNVNHSLSQHIQMLIDWINTIDEPRCMIISSLEELKSGLIITDIIKTILRALGKDEAYDLSSLEHSQPEERIDMILCILSEFYDETLLRENFSFDSLINSQTKLIEFLQFLKQMHENILKTGSIGSIDMVFIKEKNSNLFSFDGTADLVYSVESKKYNEDEGLYQNTNQESPEIINKDSWDFKQNIPSKILNKTEVNYDENKEISTNKYNFKDFPKKKTNIYENYLESYENPYDSYEKIQNKEKDINDYKTKELNLPNRQFKEYPKEESKLKNLSPSRVTPKSNNIQIHNNNLDKTPPRNKKLKETLEKTKHSFSEKSDISPTKKDTNRNKITQKVNTSYNLQQTSSISNNCDGDAKSRNNLPTVSHRSYSKNEVDDNNTSNLMILGNFKIYNKREESELYMNRGIPYITSIDISNHRYKYFRFFRATNPIKNCDIKVFDKFYQSVETTKTNFITAKLEINKKAVNSTGGNISNTNAINNTSTTCKNEDYSPSRSKITKLNNKYNYKHSEDKQDIPVQDHSEKLQTSRNQKIEQNKYIEDSFKQHYEDNSHIINQPQTKPSITDTVKRIIFEWVNGLNINGDRKLKIEELPYYFENGVLLCELINRLEGREEVLKGIHKKTVNRSQKLVNINKALEFLRKNEKMNPKHLWETNLISAGDHKVIWELLHDIWTFYNSKSKLSDNKIKKSNSSSNLKKPINNVLMLEEEVRKPESNIPLKQDNFGYNNFITLNDNQIINNEPSVETINPSKYNENYYKINRDKLFNKYSDIQNYQNVVYNNISVILGKHVKTKSNNNNKSYISRQDSKRSLHQTNERCQTELKKRTGFHSNNIAYSNKPKDRDTSCFITFENSSVSKLKLEIEKQSSKTNKTISSRREESYLNMPPTEKSSRTAHLSGENSNNSQYYTVNNTNSNPIDFMKYNTKRSFNLDVNNKNSFYNINTDPGSPSKINDSNNNLEIMNEKLKSWLIELGFKNGREFDFLRKELPWFKDGILFAKIISILERSNISGINYNPKNQSYCISNIRKVLEILRTKKNMPLDYLWSEDEISKGNSEIIRCLLMQIMKLYSKDKDLISKFRMSRGSS